MNYELRSHVSDILIIIMLISNGTVVAVVINLKLFV
jgi:hypothetical protein